MEGYARTEFGILWETHRCRPNAYGHTWSPGGELPSGMLPGHAVSTCMDYGTFLSWRESFINLEDVQRTLRLFPDCGCADWHRPTCRIGLGRRAPGPAGPRPGVPTGTDQRAAWGWADVLRALPVRDWVCRRAPADVHRPTCQIGLGRRAPGPAGPRPGVPTCTGRRAKVGRANVLRALPVRDRVCRRAPADVPSWAGPACSGPCRSETGCADVHRPTCRNGPGQRAPGPAGPRPGVPTCTGRRAELGRANVLRALPVRDRVCRRAPADVPNGAGPTCSGPCGLVH